MYMGSRDNDQMRFISHKLQTSNISQGVGKIWGFTTLGELPHESTAANLQYDWFKKLDDVSLWIGNSHDKDNMVPLER